MKNGIILSIDPGKDKCGMAVLDNKKNILEHEIIETKNILNRLIYMITKFNISLIALGNGTFSQEIKKIINESPIEKLPMLNINIITIDEKNTTQTGKKLYFKNNPPKGIWRFIPISLQTPKRPYDDYAAAAIGMKYLDEKVML